jgi:hypothetical protein
MFDPLLLAHRIPKLAERAMRDAIVARLARRGLADEALARFEALVERLAHDGVRPRLLFAERDRLVREVERFAASRLARRLFSLGRRGIVAAGRGARPFDAIVRGKSGASYAVVFRRLPRDGRRLESLRAIRNAACKYAQPLSGVVVYDFTRGTARMLLTDAVAQRHDGDLRSRFELELGEDVRYVVFDRLVAEA